MQPTIWRFFNIAISGGINSKSLSAKYSARKVSVNKNQRTWMIFYWNVKIGSLQI